MTAIRKKKDLSLFPLASIQAAAENDLIYDRLERQDAAHIEAHRRVVLEAIRNA